VADRELQSDGRIILSRASAEAEQPLGVA
jgi:hypothetical protein